MAPLHRRAAASESLSPRSSLALCARCARRCAALAAPSTTTTPRSRRSAQQAAVGAAHARRPRRRARDFAPRSTSRSPPRSTRRGAAAGRDARRARAGQGRAGRGQRHSRRPGGADLPHRETSSFLDVMFGVRDFSDFLTRARLHAARRALRRFRGGVGPGCGRPGRSSPSGRSRRARPSRRSCGTQARAKQAQVNEAVKRQQSFVAGLNAQVAKLVREERAAAGAHRRRARPPAPPRPRRPPPQEHRGAATVAASSPGLWEAVTPRPSARAEVPRRPVRLGRLGPESGFDCSGLTQYVYAKAGIHDSAQQPEPVRSRRLHPARRSRCFDPATSSSSASTPTRRASITWASTSGRRLRPRAHDRTGRHGVARLPERIDSRRDYVGACRF